MNCCSLFRKYQMNRAALITTFSISMKHEGCLKFIFISGDVIVLISVCFSDSMSRIMQHHGCRSHMRDRNKLTGQEDRFDLLVDSNDAILEKVVRVLF